MPRIESNRLTRKVDWRTARVGHVVDEDGAAVAHVADEHHAVDLVGALALLVDEREVDVQAVGDRRDPLRAARVRRHHDALLPVGHILFDPLEHRRLRVQVVHRNVEEALHVQNAHTHYTNTVQYSTSTQSYTVPSNGNHSVVMYLYLRGVQVHRYDVVCACH